MVIPATRADGKPVVSVASKTFLQAALTSLTLQEGLISIKSEAFCQNNLTTLTIPSTITTIGTDAFRANILNAVTFMGPKPTSLGTLIFYGNPGLLAGSVRVPAEYLADYQASYINFKLSSSAVITGY